MKNQSFPIKREYKKTESQFCLLIPEEDVRILFMRREYLHRIP